MEPTNEQSAARGKKDKPGEGKGRLLTKADVDARNKRWEGIPLDQPLKVEDAQRMLSK